MLARNWNLIIKHYPKTLVTFPCSWICWTSSWNDNYCNHNLLSGKDDRGRVLMRLRAGQYPACRSVSFQLMRYDAFLFAGGDPANMFLFSRGNLANKLFQISLLVCPTSVNSLLWILFPLPFLLICVLSTMFVPLRSLHVFESKHTYTLMLVLCVLLISVYVLRPEALFFPYHKNINNKGVCKYYISRFVKFREWKSL